METKGIRISDGNKILEPTLSDILEVINDGYLFHWSILGFEKQIDDSEKGVFIDWNDLNVLSRKFYQIIDITLIGCRDKSSLCRYSNDIEMYKTCDIVIELIDSGYWEVFSKDEQLINRLASKFKEIEFLESDFKK